jgi:transcriptional repressor NrdR
VLDSRAGTDQVRRRRECTTCTRRFTTYEKLAESEVIVAKRRGGAEPFDRDKLLALVSRLARGRRQSEEALHGLVRGLEASLLDVGARTVSVTTVAQRLLDRLTALDPVMAERYAANYRGEDGVIRFAEEAASPQLDLLAPPAAVAPVRRRRSSS